MRCERYRHEPNSQVPKVHQIKDSGGFVSPNDDES
jgi:hypothetical protein